MKTEKSELICNPINQLELYGYENYFNFFEKLYKKNRLPNSIILSGSKGLGKATFAYHFINFLLSKDENHKYDKEKFTINSNNSSYKLATNGIHSNLFVLDTFDEENVKVEKVRELLLFLNKTTYYKGLKIVLIDNAEKLNINSSNALLKAIEEPSKDTYFFIINNNTAKILNTIKSRCIDFNINITLFEKKNIFNNIVKKYDLNEDQFNLNNFLFFDSHGNLIKYLAVLKNSNIDKSNNHLSYISYLLEIYNVKKDNKILSFLSVFIQNYYNQLALNNSALISNYYNNLNKILYLINDMKKFSLDKKNFIFSIDKIIRNER